MSKVGKQIINIPEDVKVEINGGIIKFSGKNGILEVPILAEVSPKLENNILSFNVTANNKQARSNWGTMKAISANAVQGVTTDFIKKLKIEGIGYKANIEGKMIILNVGYSHPVKINLPEGIDAVVEKNIVKISGANKSLVGEVAAKIRAVRKPEPYKGTGIMYVGEIIRRKSGKKAIGSGKAS